MPKVSKPSGCVIGIDPSLTGSAIAVLVNDLGSKLIYPLVYRYGSEALGTDIRSRNKRNHLLIDKLACHLPKYPPTVVCIEGYSMGSKGSALTNISEFGGMLRDCLCTTYPENYTRIYEVAPSTLKKFVTGKGNSKGKTGVISAIAKKYGMEFETDDEYDAYGLARIALCLAGLVEPEGNAQKEVVGRLLHPIVKQKKRRSK